MLKPYDMCIEVDRAGMDEIVVEQVSGKCASNDFGAALGYAIGMNHEVSDRGIFTDNSLFNLYIPECVNIAAGYDRQHGPRERVKVAYVEELVDALIEVQWDKLPIKRDVSDIGEVYSYPMHGGGGYGAYIDDDFGRPAQQNFSYINGLPFTQREAEDYVLENFSKVADYLYYKKITELDIVEELRYNDDHGVAYNIPF